MHTLDGDSGSTQTEMPSCDAVVEAVLFMFGSDISFARLAQFADMSEDEVRAATARLSQEYARRDGGLRVVCTQDSVQMMTHPAVAATIERMTKKELEGPLTPVAMEVLAIIAYRGPIGKTDIEAIRGVNCSFTLRNLVRRGLIERVAPRQAASRTHTYRVTMDFLRVLGITDVAQLPSFAQLAGDARIDAILTHGTADETPPAASSS